jgi:hypothetical protein
MTNSLNSLEQAVLQKLLDGSHPILVALRKQFEAASFSSRKLTGVGFFTKFTVRSSVSPLPPPIKRLVFGDIEAKIKGLQHGAGFLLFTENGFLQTLEGYTYDEPWPDDTSVFELRYHEPDRKKILDEFDEKIKG